MVVVSTAQNVSMSTVSDLKHDSSEIAKPMLSSLNAIKLYRSCDYATLQNGEMTENPNANGVPSYSAHIISLSSGFLSIPSDLLAPVHNPPRGHWPFSQSGPRYKAPMQCHLPIVSSVPTPSNPLSNTARKEKGELQEGPTANGLLVHLPPNDGHS